VVGVPVSMIDTKAKLNESIVGHFSNVGLANRLIKAFILTGGSLVAGLAQFSDIDDAGAKTSQIVGMLGCIVVFISAIWIALKDQDSTEELKIAFESQKKYDEINSNISELYEIYEDLDKSRNLIVVNSIIRALLEHKICRNIGSEEAFVDSVFENCKRQLSLAMGLVGSDEWTICVYIAERKPGARDQLRLLGHARAIECTKDTARVWDEGVGVAGVCYANAVEVIVPDLQSDRIGTLFNIGHRKRDYDSSRYQSVVAVPVLVDGHARPWGVVTATSDRRNHFTPEASGIQNAEGARILAGAIALFVAVQARLAKQSDQA